jgi:hypothetical protein
MVTLCKMMDGPVMSVEALVRDGRCATLDFIEGLPARSRRKLDAIFGQLAAAGRAGAGDTSFKHLAGQVYEMKEHSANVRVFCFVWQRWLVVCTHGSRKPAGKARYRIEIEKVQELYAECLREGVLV